MCGVVDALCETGGVFSNSIKLMLERQKCTLYQQEMLLCSLFTRICWFLETPSNFILMSINLLDWTGTLGGYTVHSLILFFFGVPIDISDQLVQVGCWWLPNVRGCLQIMKLEMLLVSVILRMRLGAIY